MIISLLIYPTALCKLGSQNEIAKKRKINDLWKKKKGKGFKDGHSILGKEGEKK